MAAATRLLKDQPLTRQEAKGIPLGYGHGMEELVAVIRPLFQKEMSLARWVAIRGALLTLDMIAPDPPAWFLISDAMGIDMTADGVDAVAERPGPIAPAVKEKIVRLYGSIFHCYGRYAEVSKMDIQDVNAHPLWADVDSEVALDYIAWTAAAVLRTGHDDTGLIRDNPEPGLLEQPGWYADPLWGKAERWWDGTDWTQYVRARQGRGFERAEVPLH